MHSKFFLFGGILIFVFAISCNSHAYTLGSVVTITCPPIVINSLEILNDSDNSSTGVQISPPVPGRCMGLLRCSSKPSTSCCDDCRCFYIANASSPEGFSYSGEGGTHCATGFGPGYEPAGYAACDNYPVDGCTGECNFNENENWMGYGNGAYCYDGNDGYKGIEGNGIKNITVRVNISNPGGIQMVCSNLQGGGSVKMTIDNYESRKKYKIKLNGPEECNNSTLASALTSAVWTGNFRMHYWEKPGFYSVKVNAINACGSSISKNANFEYLSSAKLCIAPGDVNMDFGTVNCTADNATAYGDMNMGDCNRSDISSPGATIRNVGNTVVNAMVHSTDMVCISPGCSDVIPASKASPPSPGYLQGNLWINLGNGWNDLQTTPEKMRFTPHCSCIDYYGIPPGPHATNSFDLMIYPLKCVKAGIYRHTFTITAIAGEGKYCQDDREALYPKNNTCVLPPQCYEIPGRYTYGTACSF